MSGKSAEEGPLNSDQEYWIIDSPHGPEMRLFIDQGGFTTPEIFLDGVNEALLKVGVDFSVTTKETLAGYLVQNEKEVIFTNAELFLLQMVRSYYDYFRQKLLKEELGFTPPQTDKTATEENR